MTMIADLVDAELLPVAEPAARQAVATRRAAEPATDPRPLAVDAVADHFRSLLSDQAVQACPGILELLSTVGAALVLRLPQSDDPCEVFLEIEAAFQARRARGRQPRDVFTRWLREQAAQAGGALTIAQVRTLLSAESARPLRERWVLSPGSEHTDAVYRSGHREVRLSAAELAQRLYRARESLRNPRRRHNANGSRYAKPPEI